MYIQTEYIYGIQLQNISTGLGLFLDVFPTTTKFRVRPGPTHPLQ